MRRAAAVGRVGEALHGDWLAVACNGMIGRELYAQGDRRTRFYMVGSMGLASSIGLGLALVQPARTIVVFDGDGNLLMNLGTLGNIAASGVRNLYHVVFDNAAHGSTGHQRTISDRVPLDRVALAAGYTRAVRAGGAEALEAALATFFEEPGPAMLLVEVERGNVPGITRVDIDPPALAARFRATILESG